MKEMRDENDHLVAAIRARTDKKIDFFEDVISMTGLDSGRLERQASANAAPPASASTAAPADETASAKPHRGHGENQGGPFIPYDDSLNEEDQELLSDIDRLVVLHDIVGQLPLSQPISGAQVTGPFGRRVDPLNGRFAIHPGIDLAGPLNSRIFSTNAGKVAFAGRKVAYGNVVEIDHGYGIVTRYAHMSKILVREGETVRKGQTLGIQGSTGRSTGPHLHYEVRIDDHAVNPAKFLEAGEYVFEN